MSPDISARPTAVQLCCEHAQKDKHTVALTMTYFAMFGSVWSLTELQVTGSMFGVLTPVTLGTHSKPLHTVLTHLHMMRAQHTYNVSLQRAGTSNNCALKCTTVLNSRQQSSPNKMKLCPPVLGSQGSCFGSGCRGVVLGVWWGG